MTKPADKDSWLKLNVSPENRPVLLEALHIAAQLNDLEGLSPADPSARMAEAHRRILIEWSVENQFQFKMLMTKRHAEAQASRAQLDAVERDDYRCRRCRHSKLQQGGVQAVQIVSYDMIDPKKLGSAGEDAVFPQGRGCTANLITFCPECAAYWESLSIPERIKRVGTMLRHTGNTALVAGATSILLSSPHGDQRDGGGNRDVPMPGGPGRGGQAQEEGQRAKA